MTGGGPTLLHEFFEVAAARWPDRLAVDVPPSSRRGERRAATYAELKRRADELASAVSDRIDGISEPIVAILLPRNSVELFAAQLAVLKAGAAYLCLEPSFPDGQVREILSDSEAAVVLSDREGMARLRPFGVSVLDVGEPAQASGRGVAEASLDSLAYLIYTSGTTGKPKGVMISHRGIVNLVGSDLAEFGLGPGDRVAQGSSAAYDSSVEETWLALASGATVVVMDDEAARLGPDLVPWLREERITVLCPPPTLLRATGCEDSASELPELRLLYVGGEPLTSDVVDLWAPGRRLVNGYGPTECTVTCLRCDVVPDEEIAVGRPVTGMSAWILNEALQEVADGETGELCMSGAGLARGYHRSPELTATKFVEHPQFGRIYRTGDAARRRADGQILCFGRLDSQVKLRGYRIELEAIEVSMAQVPGVREAACHVQTLAGRQDLVGFVVPTDPENPPSFGEIRTALEAALPKYMVPVRFGLLAALPRTVGGKLKRQGLPLLEVFESEAGVVVGPRTEAEGKVHAAFQKVLGIEEAVSVEADFFTDLGGSSLLAAKLVSLMRADPELARVAVRDVYEAPTIAGLARRAGPLEMEASPEAEVRTAPHQGATAIQAGWLLAELVVGSAVAGWIVDRLDWTAAAIGALVLLLLLWPLVSVGMAVVAKRVLIGRYSALREPVWGGFYVRNWMVQQVVRRVPWRMFEGTELACVVLRALGAKIGKGVHFQRGTVPLGGGWDLLEIGDGVTLARDAALRLVTLEAGQIVVGPIRLGSDSTLGVRAGVAANASLGEGSTLTALSSLTVAAGDGEVWDGIPARLSGQAAEPESRPEGMRPGQLGPKRYAAALMGARSLLSAYLALPGIASLFLLWNRVQTGGSLGTILEVTAALAMGATLATLALDAIAMRAMGRVPEGEIPLRSWAFVRVTLKIGILESAGRWLSGSLFWPYWLRWAGMRVGPDCEISTIMDVVPELVEFEGDCFLADGIYLGPPELERGVARLSRLRMSRNTFIGNHAVIPAGQELPGDILLGVCTVANPGMVRAGSSWFGLPPFELPRREIVEQDRSLTHAPGPLRFWNRVFWEALRIVVPVGPAVAMVSWVWAVSALGFVAAPLVTIGIGAALCGAAIGLKWALLGKVRPGVHALWSCWCSRWDFHYVLWGEWARPILSALEGTLLLTPVLRMLGTKIGRRVVLGSGFSQIVDPDMIKIGDGATVSAMFQAHTFEDRVLKIDEVEIEAGATLASATVPLYGARIGERAMVTAHGVVMKHERLLPGLSYEGAPTRQTHAELPG